VPHFESTHAQPNSPSPKPAGIALLASAPYAQSKSISVIWTPHCRDTQPEQTSPSASSNADWSFFAPASSIILAPTAILGGKAPRRMGFSAMNSSSDGLRK
jgi:hypothetical protein